MGTEPLTNTWKKNHTKIQFLKKLKKQSLTMALKGQCVSSERPKDYTHNAANKILYKP